MNRLRAFLFGVVLSTVLFSTLIFVDCPGLTLSTYNVLIEPGKIRASVRLVNDSSRAQRYRISFVERMMTETGELRKAEKTLRGQYASDVVLFAPRRVDLPPHSSQRVLLQVNRVGLRPGEYRSHLLFREVPNRGSVVGESDRKRGVSISLTPLTGVSIPVIVRRGETSARVRITKLRLAREGDTPSLTMEINRSGNQSVRGDIEVIHISSCGKMQRVVLFRGISVYTPLNTRSVKVGLPAGSEGLNEGFLRLIFWGGGVDTGEVLAERKLKL